MKKIYNKTKTIISDNKYGYKYENYKKTIEINLLIDDIFIIFYNIKYIIYNKSKHNTSDDDKYNYIYINDNFIKYINDTLIDDNIYHYRAGYYENIKNYIKNNYNNEYCVQDDNKESCKEIYIYVQYIYKYL